MYCDHIDLKDTLYSASLLFVYMHIVVSGGSNHFLKDRVIVDLRGMEGVK